MFSVMYRVATTTHKHWGKIEAPSDAPQCRGHGVWGGAP